MVDAIRATRVTAIERIVLAVFGDEARRAFEAAVA
jgi:hypothetical protein